MKSLRLFTAGTVLLALAGTLSAAPFVELKNGQRITGTDIRAKSDGTIVLTRDNGPVEFAPNQVKRAVADQPGNLQAAMRAAASEGSAKQAIPVLEKLAQDYKNLYWDGIALDYLGRAQAASGDPQKALRTYDKLFAAYPESKTGDARWGFYQALLSAKEYTRLEKLLTEEIGQGDRPSAALAQILRGDIRATQGDREGAAINYLRSALLFGNTDHHPQALYKAGLALEQMKDPRAKAQFQAAVASYPDSPWAAKAKQKL